MRINGKSPLVKAALIIPCLGVFAVVWPVGVSALLDALPRAQPTHVDIDLLGTLTFFAMIFVGLFMGIHAGTMINEGALWLRSKGKRTAFLLISGIFAACITYINSTGGIDDQNGPASYRLIYFLTVQALPLLWFLFNLHGESWLWMLARRRRRQTAHFPSRSA